MANEGGSWGICFGTRAVLGRIAEQKLTVYRSSVILRLHRLQIFPGKLR